MDVILFVLIKNYDFSLGELEVKIEEWFIVKVSFVGVGMIGWLWVVVKMFEILVVVGINMIMIFILEVKVSCIVDVEDCEKVINFLFLVFDVNVVDIFMSFVDFELGEVFLLVWGVVLDIN